MQKYLSLIIPIGAIRLIIPILGLEPYAEDVEVTPLNAIRLIIPILGLER